MNENQTQNNRRLALAAWIRANGGARQACVKKGLGKSVESHISQILRGYSFGARAARNLETKLGIPHGLLDEVSSVSSVSTATHFGGAGLGGGFMGMAGDISNTSLMAGDVINIPQYRMNGLINKNGASRAFSGSGMRLLLRDQPGVITDMRVSIEWLHKNVRNFTRPENLCIVTGFGDSMSPMYNAGDPLLVDTGVDSVVFDSVYFLRIEGEGFIKRLQRIPGEGYRVLSSNPAYETWTLKPDTDFEVLGRVLKAWVSRDF